MKSPEKSGAFFQTNHDDSRKARERRTVRGYLYSAWKIFVGLAITWALLALLYYVTDPQVMMFREWFR